MKANSTLAAFAGVLLIATAGLARAGDQGATAAPASAAAESRLFGGVVMGSIKASATVEKIDYLTREVILRRENGELESLVAGPEVQRLTEIHPGDTIEATYTEAVVVTTGPSADVGPSHNVSTSVVRAPKSEAPGAVASKTTSVVATIEALDFKARTATLKGPNKTVTVEVGPGAVNFEKVKVGDVVMLEVTQAIAASVIKKAPAAEPAK